MGTDAPRTTRRESAIDERREGNISTMRRIGNILKLSWSTISSPNQRKSTSGNKDSVQELQLDAMVKTCTILEEHEQKSMYWQDPLWDSI